MKVQIFYIGLTLATKTLVNAVNKTEEAAYALLEEMAMTSDHGGADRSILRRQMPVNAVESVKALTEQIATLSKQLQNAQLGVNAIMTCQWCQGPHLSETCQVGNPMLTERTEQTQFIGNNNSYGNSYNPAWRNHPNFSWRNAQNIQNPPSQMQQAPLPRENKVDLESLMAKMAEHTNSFMAETRTALQSQSAQIRSLETQINQLANANNQRQHGTLPSNTVGNPKEQ